MKQLSLLRLTSFVVALVNGQALMAEQWQVIAGKAVRNDAAFRVAQSDLRKAGARYGIELTLAADDVLPAGNVMLVGGPARNAQTAALAKRGLLALDAVDDEQGYAIVSTTHEGRRIIAVAGGSVIGDVYGLYWIWDRLQVHQAIPEINCVRVPALKVRVSATWGRHGRGGRTEAQMHDALRYSINWVSGPAILDLVPWDSAPERDTNRKNRDKTRALIAYAHSLHMKYFSFANEFTYHPSLLQEHGATLNPGDPKYWRALQDKYRKLFTALPELDGIELCNDDISGFWDRYRSYDVLHATPECEWSYEKRFRTFVRKVHAVVAGEFDKTYFHFTWGLGMHEQHYQPAVFRNIFTDAVPTDNLYLMPKITAGDRWWHQPYNATFNQTPHDTIVCFETINYYESGRANIFPTFSGQYFQRGLQTFLLPEESNLKGGGTLALAGPVGWDTRGAYSYVLYRLLWNPNEDMDAIARDFCALNFGPEAAAGMAEIYLLSPSAYKYGLHLEPVSYGKFNSFIHMRVGTFPAEGYPAIDSGRAHLEFLRTIYLRCKPWARETLDDLAHGLRVADSMWQKLQAVKPKIDDAALANDLENRLAMTRRLLATNNGYAKVILAYFDYMDGPTPGRRAALHDAYTYLAEARAAFVATPRFGYNLFGVDAILASAQAALDDVEAARTALDNAPTRSELVAAIARHQQRYAEVLAEYKDEAVLFAHFEAQIDGRDILSITGDKYTIDHLRWDGPHIRDISLTTPLPKAEYTVIPKNIYSRPIHPFVLQQPNAANNYTFRLYLDDLPAAQDWVICDLYYIPKAPQALGLALPW